MHGQQNIKSLQKTSLQNDIENFQNQISKTTLSSPPCDLNILLTLTYLLTNLLTPWSSVLFEKLTGL